MINFFNIEKKLTNSLINQIIVSGGNFITTLLLIKILNLSKFGEYSLIVIISYFFISLTNGFIFMPFTTHFKNEKNYLLGSIQLFIIFYLFILIICYLIFSYNLLKLPQNLSIIHFFLFIFSLNLQIFTRRILFSSNLQRLAIYLDAFIYLTLLSILSYFVLSRTNIKIEQILLIQYFIIIFFISFLSIFFIQNFRLNLNSLKVVFMLFRKNSIYLGLSQLTSYFTGNLVLLLSGLYISVTLLGIYRTLTTVGNLFNLLFQSYENYLPQNISLYLEKSKSSELRRYLISTYKFNLLLIFFLIIILYLLFDNIFRFIDPNLLQYKLIFVFILFYAPIIFLNLMNTFILRSLDKSENILYNNFFILLIAIIFSKYLLIEYQIYGFIIYTYFQLILTFLFTTYSIKKN